MSRNCLTLTSQPHAIQFHGRNAGEIITICSRLILLIRSVCSQPHALQFQIIVVARGKLLILTN